MALHLNLHASACHRSNGLGRLPGTISSRCTQGCQHRCFSRNASFSGRGFGACTSRRIATPLAASSVEASSPQPQATGPGLEVQEVSSKDPWQHMLELQAAGTAVECTITGYNKGGVLVLVEGLKGFVPYSKLDRSRLKPGHQGELDYLIGQVVKAQVIQVDIQSARKEVVLSEIQAFVSQTLRSLKQGDVVVATVTRLQDYGAFVAVQPPAGGAQVQGLVHVSELSWGKVMSVNSVLSVGQTVQLVVLDSDPVRGRLSLSLRRLQRDPLKQNIDTMMPSGEDEVEWKEPKSAPILIAAIIQQLRRIEGVEDVSLGRQARVLSTIAPEMQVFLSREERDDGVVVVTRTGPLLQELRLVTSLSREEVKKVLQKIMVPKSDDANVASNSQDLLHITNEN